MTEPNWSRGMNSKASAARPDPPSTMRWRSCAGLFHRRATLAVFTRSRTGRDDEPADPRLDAQRDELDQARPADLNAAPFACKVLTQCCFGEECAKIKNRTTRREHETDQH